MQRLKNKLALITGGTSGIGLATAKDFISEGARVIFTGRHQNTVNDTVRLLGSNSYGVVSDAAGTDGIEVLKEELLKIGPELDILFINAGYGKFGPVETFSKDVVDEVFNVLVKGCFFTVQALLPALKKGSTIIINTSVVTRYGSPYASVYSAAKAALASFVKTFAAEFTDRGIRVNGISPGYTQTKAFEKTGMSKEQVEATIQSVLPTLPFGRFAAASEIAKAVSFLASDDASYIHGTELVADGGYTVIK